MTILWGQQAFYRAMIYDWLFFTIDWFLKSYNVWRAYCWLTNNLIGVKYKGICMTASKRLNVIVPEQLLYNDQYIDCDV